MQELLPFLSGACVGILIAQLRTTPQRKTALFIVLCLIIGTFASWISGELAISSTFISFDMALVWLGASLAIGLASAWRRLRAPRT